MKQKLLILFAFLLIGISSKVQAYSFSAVHNGQTIYYNISYSTGGVEVTYGGSINGIASYSGAVIIPDTVIHLGIKYPVLLIRDHAFENCSGLSSVVLPNTLVSIGSYAFSKTGLLSINIPKSVIYITNSAFDYSGTLSSINVDMNSPKYSSNDGILYNKNSDTLLICPNGKRGTLIIPNNVVSISSDAFRYCDSISTISIPSSVISMGKLSFIFCSRLTSINVDANNPKYSSSNGMVFSKNNDTLLICPEGKSGAIIVPNFVSCISNRAFYFCGGLTSIIIPNSVTSIGSDAFADCMGLKTISLSNNLISIEPRTFSHCTSLDSIIIPIGITQIGEMAFFYCISLKSIVSNPINPPNIGSDAFYDVSIHVPITVPCSSKISYQFATGWKNFINFIGGGVDNKYIYDTICNGQSYTQNGFHVDSTGIYVLTLQNSNGCDSNIILNLIVNPSPLIPDNISIQKLSNYFEITWASNGNSYELFRNDTLIATTNQPIYLDYDIINAKAYCYKVKSVIGDCKSEFSNIVCKSFVGLNNELDSNISINLYPNPAKNKTILEVEGINEMTNIFISDLFGRIVGTYKIKSQEQKMEIDVSSFYKGIYVVSIRNNNIDASKKLVVE